jgi:hypothetical protein
MPTDININLPNTPGALARLGEALGGAGVNIDGVACLPVGEKGSVHILVEDAAGARSALEGGGIEVISEAEAVVVDVDDRPGKLGEVTRAAADAGINLDVVYLATATRLVLVAADAAALRDAVG